MQFIIIIILSTNVTHVVLFEKCNANVTSLQPVDCMDRWTVEFYFSL